MTEIHNKINKCKEFMQKLCDKELIKYYYHVGSSAVLKDISTSKDFDFICLVESFSKFEQDLLKPEFEKLNEKLNPEINGEYANKLPVNSYRLVSDIGELNLVIIESYTYYMAYKYCTEAQQNYRLNIKDKEERIKFHGLFVKNYYNNHRAIDEPDYYPEDSCGIPQPTILRDTMLGDLV